MLAFIDQPAQAPDASCVDYLPPPLFAVVDITEVDNQPYNSDTLGFSGVVPDGWFEFAPGLFSPYPRLGNPVPLLAYRFPDNLDQYVADIITNPEGVYRYDALPEPEDDITANGRAWQLYRIESQGIVASFAMSDDGGTAYVIGMIAADDTSHDFLRDALLIPAVEAFTPGE
jgi:hypothetical protein